jgi:hypothetical protein
MHVGFYTDTYNELTNIGLPIPNYIKRYINSPSKARLIYKIADYRGDAETKARTTAYLTDIMNILLFTNEHIVGYVNPQNLSLKGYNEVSDKPYHIADFDALISKNMKREMNFTNVKIGKRLNELKAQKNTKNMLWEIVCFYGVFLARVNKFSKPNCDKIVNFVVFNLRKVGHNINNKKYINDTKKNLFNYATAHRLRLKERNKLTKQNTRAIS